MERLIYLHGFASSPASKKARLFESRVATKGSALIIPDLNGGDFSRLTITGQLQIIDQAAQGQTVSLIGSSLGGYLAALFAARHRDQCRRVVLLAPAFGFARRWASGLGIEQLSGWQESGWLEVMNYAQGAMARLGWQLMEDAQLYEEEPVLSQPAIIFHGVHDDVVPVEASRQFARKRPGVVLREVDSDHELLNVVDEVFDESWGFLSE